MNTKITLPKLQKIIAEEIAFSINESVDHASIRDVVNAASKLLAAVEAFNEIANASMINSLTPQLSSIEKTLENMVSSPGSYVEKQKPEMKRVSFQKVKQEKVV